MRFVGLDFDRNKLLILISFLITIEQIGKSLQGLAGGFQVECQGEALLSKVNVASLLKAFQKNWGEKKMSIRVCYAEPLPAAATAVHYLIQIVKNSANVSLKLLARSIVGASLLGLTLASCGSRRGEYELDKGKNLSANLWNRAPAGTYMAVDKYFFDQSSSRSFFSCLKSSGITEFIGGYNVGLGASGARKLGSHLQNAMDAGLGVSAYYAFNSGSNISSSAISGFLDQIRGKPINMVWIDIEAPVGGVSNLESFYNRVCVDEGYKCGVYTNFYGMDRSGLSKSGVSFLKPLPLWFADASGELNPKRNFDNFYGWRQSTGRQIYLDDNLCGTRVDVNIMDQSLLSDDFVPPEPIPERKTKPCAKGDEAFIANLSGDAHVKVRSGPSTGDGELGKLPDGSKITIGGIGSGASVNDRELGQQTDVWYGFYFNNEKGYISSLYANCYE